MIPYRGRTDPAGADEGANPDTPLGEAQIVELVGYVASLGDGPAIPDVDPETADLARGGDLYRLNCAPCHNWDGKGGALVNGRNAPSLHDAPAVQVAEAIRVGPGAMPLFGEEVLDERDLDDVVAYVEYLKQPRDRGGWALAHWGPATEGVAGLAGLGLLLLVAGWLGKRTGKARGQASGGVTD